MCNLALFPPKSAAYTINFTRFLVRDDDGYCDVMGVFDTIPPNHPLFNNRYELRGIMKYCYYITEKTMYGTDNRMDFAYKTDLENQIFIIPLSEGKITVKSSEINCFLFGHPSGNEFLKLIRETSDLRRFYLPGWANQSYRIIGICYWYAQYYLNQIVKDTGKDYKKLYLIPEARKWPFAYDLDKEIARLAPPTKIAGGLLVVARSEDNIQDALPTLSNIRLRDFKKLYGNAEITLMIDDIKENSQARKIGLTTQDNILEYDGQKITSVFQLYEEIEKKSYKEKIELLISRAGEPMRFFIKGGPIGITVYELPTWQSKDL